MKALPAMPYGAVVKLERRASHEGMVSVRGNYSVPDTTSRRSFDVLVLAEEIRIFEDGAVVAIHAPLEGRGEKRLDPLSQARRLMPTRPARGTPDRDARRRSRRSSLARLLRRRRPPSWRSRRRPMSAPSVIERVKTPPVALKMPRALEILDVNPRSRRIRESRKGRPCNELGSQPTVYRRPARTFVLPAPRVQDGLTISPSPFRKQADSKARTDHVPDNGQVERMNRTIKDATVRRYHYDSNGQLVRHLDDFVAAYNFARRLKILNGLTPYEFICKRWTIEPKRFSLNPLQQMPGLNMLLRQKAA